MIRLLLGMFVRAIWLIIAGISLLMVGLMAISTISNLSGGEIFMWSTLALFAILMAWNWNSLFPGRSTKTLKPLKPTQSEDGNSLAGKSFNIEGVITIEREEDGGKKRD